MKKTNTPSKVKSRMVYTEVRDPDEDNQKKVDSYDFAAKFKKGKEDPKQKSKTSQQEKESAKEITSLRESLVVETNAPTITIATAQPESMAYKVLMKTYIIDTKLVCPFLSAAILIIATVALGVWSQNSMTNVVQYTIPYGSLLHNQMQFNFSRNLPTPDNFPQFYLARPGLFLSTNY